MSTLTAFRLFSRAPWTRIRSWVSAGCRLAEVMLMIMSSNIDARAGPTVAGWSPAEPAAFSVAGRRSGGERFVHRHVCVDMRVALGDEPRVLRQPGRTRRTRVASLLDRMAGFSTGQPPFVFAAWASIVVRPVGRAARRDGKVPALGTFGGGHGSIRAFSCTAFTVTQFITGGPRLRRSGR